MQNAIVFRFLTMFVTGSLDDGWSLQFLEVEIHEVRINVQMVLLLGIEDVVVDWHFASRSDGDFSPLLIPNR